MSKLYIPKIKTEKLNTLARIRKQIEKAKNNTERIKKFKIMEQEILKSLV